MSSNKWAIVQTIRTSLLSIGSQAENIIVDDESWEEYEGGFILVRFSINYQIGLTGIVLLQGQYHDQPGFLFLESGSMYNLIAIFIRESFDKHKSDYPHSIGM